MRRLAKQYPIALAGVALAGIAVRRLGRQSGATSEEVPARLPGDEIVRDPLYSCESAGRQR